MNTLYDVLGVSRHADEKAIRTAFRKAAKSHHPDLNADKPVAEQQFRELVAAYELLKNPQLRQAYDLQLKIDRRVRVRRFAAPFVAGLMSGGVVAAGLVLWNPYRAPEPPPRMAIAVNEPASPQAATADTSGGGESVPAADKSAPDDPPTRQSASLDAGQREGTARPALEWTQVLAAGDPMAIWEFAVRNPDSADAQRARSKLLDLIDTTDNIFLLQILRTGAPDAVAERARQRLLHVRPSALTDDTVPAEPSKPLEERATGFVAAQISAWSSINSRNLDALTDAYAGEVLYNGSLKPRLAVLRDKRRLLEQWPERLYDVLSGSIKAECIANVCRVGGTMEWKTRNPARSASASGTSQFEYGIILSGGEFSILSESSTAVKRDGLEAKR